MRRTASVIAVAGLFLLAVAGIVMWEPQVPFLSVAQAPGQNVSAIQQVTSTVTASPPHTGISRALGAAKAELAGISPEVELVDIVARDLTWSEFVDLSGFMFGSGTIGVTNDDPVWLVAFVVKGDLDNSTFSPPGEGGTFEELARTAPTRTPGPGQSDTVSSGYYVLDGMYGTKITQGQFDSWNSDFSFESVGALPGSQTPTPVLTIVPYSTP